MAGLRDAAGGGKSRWDHEVDTWLSLLISYKGRERQAAIKALQRLRYAPALPLLLLRANDWVPQVRKAADTALRSFLGTAFLAQWLDALDALVALTRAKRADHRELLLAVGDFLGQAGHLPDVVEASKQASVAVKRFVFDLQWRNTDDETARCSILSQALAGTDVVLASQAMVRIADIAPSRAAALAAVACRSHFASVRADGFRLALRDPDPSTASLVHAMCLDGSSTLRALALGALKAQGEADAVFERLAAQLGNAALSDRAKAIHLHFLWSADPEKARPHCESALASRSPALRRVAMSALLTTNEGRPLEALLLRAFSDESSKIQMLAVKKVQRGAPMLPEEKLVSMALTHATPGALVRAAALLTHSPTWTRLLWLLHLLGEVLPEGGTDICLEALRKWERDAFRNFMAPTPRHHADLARSWRSVAQKLPVPLRDRIAFHLESFRVETGRAHPCALASPLGK